jgi:hypothetical protein
VALSPPILENLMRIATVRRQTASPPAIDTTRPPHPLLMFIVAVVQTIAVLVVAMALIGYLLLH